MQPVQRASNNFPYFVTRIAKNQGVLQQKCNEGPSFGYIFTDFLAKDLTNFLHKDSKKQLSCSGLF